MKYAHRALFDLKRLYEFLRQKSPSAAGRASEVIKKSVHILADHPGIGRAVVDMPEEYRELLIPFGDSGYVLRYRIERDEVIVLAIRHQKEAGVS
ncbi:MAG: type II toxin-antitoxin system RelE/ParE family toxin [Synergistaceae bacterium]|nr:type II toxin-antitoxin system RelE/ParE family toxin [Synergistaceae bacterium]